MEILEVLSLIYRGLSYALYPVLYVVLLLIQILHWLITPLIYISIFIKEIALLPVRFLAHFEALWYFLGAAVLVGAVLGLTLHLTMRVFTVILKLDQRPYPKKVPATGHDIQSYRAARQEKKQREVEGHRRLAEEARLIAAQALVQEPPKREAPGRIRLPAPSSSARNPLSPGTRQPALLRETILEDTDEEDDVY